MILQPRRPVGYRTETKQRPFELRDPERRVNEFAVLRTEPRQVIMIASFSNPQARIVAPGARFMWFKGEALLESGPELTQPLLLSVKHRFQALWCLADVDLVIDEAVLVFGQDIQAANFSFRDRFITLHLPEYHLEWTEGVGLGIAAAGSNPDLKLGPEGVA